MNYTFLLILILIVTVVTIYSSKKKKRTTEFLKSLESEYPNRIKTNGKVKFSRIHILLDVDLNILYSENNLLIYGFDYYRHRKTRFIFHTNQNLKDNKENRIPNYLITKIDVIENEKIIITDENNCKITIMFKSYGKEKTQLKEEKFLELIKKLNKNYW
ncbi:hypothetical protein DMZ43_04975 [Meridianimaribacter sp. CL38]|uniref:hypothetical protein n=1 Tax=Meridianimaribacter sp. CL38 TaxID=2213021 RepID=UPI0010406D70|nr:hypothetical protein [Meridianimaribacter sp. CL38]TBV28395.1 hypothetical protein DMZ43_04975 [Meridianimaribacter sp. CL38]